MPNMTAFTDHFARFARLAAHELRLLDNIATGPRATHVAGERIAPGHRFLASGWVASERWLPDGRRQLLQLSVTGEPLTFTELPRHLAIIALAPAVTVEGARIWEAGRDALANPGISAALAAMEAEAGFFAREHIVRLGRMTALERLASLLLEIGYRNRWADTIPFPLTQMQLADLLGLSAVHVNRTMQELRRLGVIGYGSNTLTLLDRHTLRQLACFVEPASGR